MPNVTIVKIKVRRGTDDQRRAVILEQGELGFTTDTKKLYVGDGITEGGIPVASQIYTPLSRTFSITGVPAGVGEIVPAGSLIYQLTASNYRALSSWANISTKPDDVTLEYTGGDSKVLSLKKNSIKNDSFNSSAAYQFGGITATTNNGLSANVDGTYVVLSSNKITISPISADKISSQVIGSGLEGGNGNKINLKVGSEFGFDLSTKALRLTSIPSGLISVSALDISSIYGDGLAQDVNGKLILDKPNIYGYGLNLDLNNKLAVNGDSLVSGVGNIKYNGTDRLYVDLSKIAGANLTVNTSTSAIDANIPTADGYSIIADSNNIFTIAPLLSDTVPTSVPTIEYNLQGQITDIYSSFTDILTASNTGPISAFNGYVNQISLSGARTNQTLVSVTSALRDSSQNVIGTTTIVLSSAGFITLNSTVTEDEGTIDRFAIPVFTY